jgi:hypothetical protein
MIAAEVFYCGREHPTLLMNREEREHLAWEK